MSEEDIASSLLYLITDQMTQTAYLVAQCHGVHRAIFCGSFLGHNLSIIAQIRDKLAAASSYLNVSVYLPILVQISNTFAVYTVGVKVDFTFAQIKAYVVV